MESARMMFTVGRWNVDPLNSVSQLYPSVLAVLQKSLRAFLIVTFFSLSVVAASHRRREQPQGRLRDILTSVALFSRLQHRPGLPHVMSYYFVIISPTDSPLFELTFGTWKGSTGDGVARFRNGETSRYMNQFIVHASIDVVEEVQWLSPNMWLKVIDNYAPTSSHVSCFLTGSNVRFMLLHQPLAAPTSSAGSRMSTISSNSVPHNPTSPQTEEAIRQFMTEVYELWVKTTMNPFYRLGNQIQSPVFRQRVVAAGRKWL